MAVNITHLAEEIIVKIFKYLSGKDLINISQTNSQFNRILCDKECLSDVDFSKAYTCTTEDIKNFFTARARCHNISSLNLSTCYWIKVYPIICKLKNLQSLQMLSIPLTFLQLDAVLKSCQELLHLSISWPEDKMPCAEWKEMLLQLDKEYKSLSKLKSFEVTIDRKYEHLWELLAYCRNVKRLVIYNHHSRKDSYSDLFTLTENPSPLNFPYLQELIIDQVNLSYPLSYIWDIIGSEQLNGETPVVWKTCWYNGFPYFENRQIHQNIIASCSRLFFYMKYNSLGIFEDVGALENLKELMVIGAAPFNIPLNIIVNVCPNLKSLNVLVGLNITLDIVKVYDMLPNLERLSLHCQPEQGPPKIIGGVAQFRNLTHLTVPVCALIEVKENRSESPERIDSLISFKRRRIGMSLQPSDVENAAFNEVFNNCTKLVMLQIGFGLETSCSPMKVNWECLVNVKRLSELRHLTLDGIPISNGNFLIEIAKGCSQLEFLRLRHLGPSGKCVYVAPLAEALTCCKNLVHLRIEQGNVAPGTSIFNALENCEKLERFTYLCERDNIPADSEALDHLIETRSSLIFVFVVSRSITKEICKKLTRKYRNVKSRPALVVRVRNVLHDVFENDNRELHSIPICHYNEMITFRSWMYETYNKF